MLKYESIRAEESGKYDSELAHLSVLASQYRRIYQDYPNLALLFDAQKKEKRVDWDKTRLEQAALAERLTRSGAKKTLEFFLADMNHAKREKTSQVVFLTTFSGWRRNKKSIFLPIPIFRPIGIASRIF